MEVTPSRTSVPQFLFYMLRWSWPLALEALFESQIGHCGICDGQSGTGTDFFFPVSVIPPVLHTLIEFVCHRRNTNVATETVLRLNTAWVGITQYNEKATCRTVRDSNTSEGKIFFFST
jgi:hypothetical protein